LLADGNAEDATELMDARAAMIPPVASLTARIEMAPSEPTVFCSSIYRKPSELSLMPMHFLKAAMIQSQFSLHRMYCALGTRLKANFRELFLHQRVYKFPDLEAECRQAPLDYLNQYKAALPTMTRQRTIIDYLRYPFIREFESKREAVLYADKLEKIVSKIHADIRRYADKGYTRVSKPWP
jgi:hypothetical protein